jgi:alpha-galactosidase
MKIKTSDALFPALLAGAIALCQPPAAQALENGLAKTPPMGWNSWNRFECNLDESLVRATADAMATNGMKAAGYEYINLDDCWSDGRDSAGNLTVNTNKFPSGMKALADYVHAKGLKLGIYADLGTSTCAGFAGTFGYHQQDADQFAAWTIDYVKVDWCNADKLIAAKEYASFRDALAKCGRPIVYSICEWGANKPWEWAPDTGNLWRTTYDIRDKWSSITSIMDLNNKHAARAKPGAWNDPDMLEVGNYGKGVGGGGMTDTEYRSHFSIWAIMAAPLISGNDLRSMNQTTLDILTNPEVIAVDQDPLGKQGAKVCATNGLEVWSKELSGTNTRAVALLNRSSAAADITVNWSQVGLPDGAATVRDLWARADLGTFTNCFAAKDVPAHGTVMIKVVSSKSKPMQAK